MRRSFLLGVVGFSMVALLTAAGCRDDRGEARSIARTFMSATEDGDTATAQTVVTKKARELFASGNSTPNSKHDGNESFTIGDPVIKEDQATVPVALTDDKGTQQAKLLMRREEGNWRVYAMNLPTYPGGPAITMDFENPMAVIPDAMHAAGVMFGQAARGFEKGATEFARGVNEGYGQVPVPAGGHQTTSPTPGATVEEVPSPPPSRP